MRCEAQEKTLKQLVGALREIKVSAAKLYSVRIMGIEDIQAKANRAATAGVEALTRFWCCLVVCDAMVSIVSRPSIPLETWSVAF